MAVTRVGPAGRVSAVAAVVALALAACGPDAAGGDLSPTSTPTRSDGSDDDVDGTDEATVDIPPMNIVAGLGYPRDLLDRGRVNIRIDRDDDVEFVLLDKQLVSTHFTPAPPEQRRTVIPPNGQVVAVQTQFGEVADCDDAGPVESELVVSYTIGDDPTVRQTSLEVDDATTLDDVRLQVCTQRRVTELNEFELQADEVDGETMTARLVVRRREGADRLAFEAIKGTVLFGADAAVEAGSPDRVLDPDEGETTIALTFTVNRCDPHAVAETTRKYGLDVYVAVDDIAAQRIDVPVESIVPQLDGMLEHCKERTGQ